MLWGDLMNTRKKSLLAIALALEASHNTVTTDIVGVEPGETSWRINHTKELALVAELLADVSTGTCLECADRNKRLLMPHAEAR